MHYNVVGQGCAWFIIWNDGKQADYYRDVLGRLKMFADEQTACVYVQELNDAYGKDATPDGACDDNVA